MENKLEVGMYVRFKYGIRKIEKIESINNQKFYCLDESYISDEPEYHYQILESEILGEPSHDITDLIEKDDVIAYYNKLQDVKGLIIERVQDNDYIKRLREFVKVGTIDILQILTHEQFEQNSYKIGE